MDHRPQQLIAPNDLAQLAEQLGVSDYRVVEVAHDALLQAGQPGIQAVLRGLEHTNPRIRRGCADFLDHNGDDSCIEALCRALHDPVPYVRRQAVHSLSCQRCKSSPLCVDAVRYLIESAQNDTSIKVRREAVSGLLMQPRDARTIPMLQAILHDETDKLLRKGAHYALKHHDPSYRAHVDAQARAQNMKCET